MVVVNNIYSHKIHKYHVVIIQVNQYFTIQKKDGHVVIRLYMIGISFRSCQHVQKVLIQT
jgi:hypothetical protein